MLSLHHLKDPHKYYLCRCDCGTEKVVQGNSLRTGRSKSCGCLTGDSARERFTTHKMSTHPAYQNWLSMHARCNGRCKTAPRYVEFGIKVCDKWATFSGFWEDMGATWTLGLTLERNDVFGHYEISNCRWAPMSEQAANRSDTVWVDTDAGKMCLSRACRMLGVSYATAQARRKRGLPQSEWLKRT